MRDQIEFFMNLEEEEKPTITEQNGLFPCKAETLMWMWTQINFPKDHRQRYHNNQ